MPGSSGNRESLAARRNIPSGSAGLDRDRGCGDEAVQILELLLFQVAIGTPRSPSAAPTRPSHRTRRSGCESRSLDPGFV